MRENKSSIEDAPTVTYLPTQIVSGKPMNKKTNFIENRICVFVSCHGDISFPVSLLNIQWNHSSFYLYWDRRESKYIIGWNCWVNEELLNGYGQMFTFNLVNDKDSILVLQILYKISTLIKIVLLIWPKTLAIFLKSWNMYCTLCH